MNVPFSKTRLEQSSRRWRLLDPNDGLLIELHGVALDRAIQSGFVDPGSPHRTLFEYHRILQETRDADVVGEPPPPPSIADFDRGFLGDIGIRWD